MNSRSGPRGRSKSSSCVENNDRVAGLGPIEIWLKGEKRGDQVELGVVDWEGKEGRQKGRKEGRKEDSRVTKTFRFVLVKYSRGCFDYILALWRRLKDEEGEWQPSISALLDDSSSFLSVSFPRREQHSRRLSPCVKQVRNNRETMNTRAFDNKFSYWVRLIHSLSDLRVSHLVFCRRRRSARSFVSNIRDKQGWVVALSWKNASSFEWCSGTGRKLVGVWQPKPNESFARLNRCLHS